MFLLVYASHPLLADNALVSQWLEKQQIPFPQPSSSRGTFVFWISVSSMTQETLERDHRASLEYLGLREKPISFWLRRAHRSNDTC